MLLFAALLILVLLPAVLAAQAASTRPHLDPGGVGTSVGPASMSSHRPVECLVSGGPTA